MASYAALVSVMKIIEQLQQQHPRPPISLDKTQVQSLTKHVTFLQEFLESNINSNHRALEIRIADAAHAAEDIIESHVVDQILKAASTSYRELHYKETAIFPQKIPSGISSVDFYEGLQKVIGDMDLIEKEVIEIQGKMIRTIQDDDHQLHRSSSMPTESSSRSHPTTGNQSITVGLDDVLIEVMDKLTCLHRSTREIIPIVGMGGIGKTTLARNIYVNPFIVHHFDVLAWATVSQNYSIKEILLEVLSGGNTEMREKWSHMNEEHQLGVELHKKLSGRRYLVIMDDVWSIEMWDKIKFFFPDNGNGSRIVITTRLSNLAIGLTHTHGHAMSFLDDIKGWDLFCKIAFGGEDCPTRELEEVGKKIVENCRGLPLSISVIGGLLAKSAPTQKYWEYIAKNVISIVNLEDDERCLKILQTSYDNLPVHLKPCFLYMGVYREDTQIRVSELIKLWVAEGFLKPISGKSLEAVAKEYLHDLIDRNLILVGGRGCTGNIKFCKIHDVLRDLCLREAEKERFFHVAKTHHSTNIPQGINTQRRIVFHQSTSKEPRNDTLEESVGSSNINRSFFSPLFLPKGKKISDCLPRDRDALGYATTLARSLIYDSSWKAIQQLKFRLLRVVNEQHPFCHPERQGPYDDYPIQTFQAQVNLRYLTITDWRVGRYLPSVPLLWNIQTLIVSKAALPSGALWKIWMMPQLRHAIFGRLNLPDPPIVSHVDRGDHDFVLPNLQTLSRVDDFRCGEEVVKRIPNIKKLKISYAGVSGYSAPFKGCSYYCLYNLSHLHKLESLGCFFWTDTKPISREDLLRNIIFPRSLKKLTLYGTKLPWEDMPTMVGSLRHLEVLKLRSQSFVGPVWETVEDQFCSLKSLQIINCYELECWTTADSTHFPRLEHLIVKSASKLKEIPSCFGDIATLRSIQLEQCRDSVVISAKEILDEQEERGEVGLQVRAHLPGRSKLRESLSGELANFSLY